MTHHNNGDNNNGNDGFGSSPYGDYGAPEQPQNNSPFDTTAQGAPNAQDASYAQGGATAFGAGYPEQPQNPGTFQGAGSEPGFIKALFDFDFKHFVTIKFVKVIYIVFLALSALGALFLPLAWGAAGAQDSAGAGLLLFIVGLLFGAVILAFEVVAVRVFLEFFVATIRNSQNTTKLVELEEQRQR